MAAQYSILKYVPNPISGEAIAVGLLVIQSNTSFFCYSKQKLDLCSRIAPEAVSLFRLFLKSFHTLVAHQTVADANQIFLIEPQITAEMLAAFARYHNGIVQFSAPAFIDKTFSQTEFEQFYFKVMGSYLDGKESNIGHTAIPGLVSKVHRHFKNVLSEQADIDYTIHRGQLPNLYFDFKLDAAAYNGKMYTAKAVDFAGLKHTESIERTIQQYEVLANRMNEVAANKGLDQNGEYWLVVDPYQGNIAELRSFYQSIENGLPGIKVAPSSAIAQFSTSVIDSGAKPLSQLIGIEEIIKQ